MFSVKNQVYFTHFTADNGCETAYVLDELIFDSGDKRHILDLKIISMYFKMCSYVMQIYVLVYHVTISVC